MRGQLSNQASQPFISASQWDESALYAQTSLRANEHLGGTVSSVLCIDESSHAKKGKASVGVARQWNGLLGKEDNCQTGVYSALTCGPHVCLAGARLYLPQLSLCNSGEKTSLKQLARWQAARFWMERCFQDAKSHWGMGQYQARGWLAWHHHMALVALAVLFQMQERMSGETGILHLTTADIVELME
ncbi:MAG: transposase [Verrucomicrobium sp.]